MGLAPCGLNPGALIARARYLPAIGELPDARNVETQTFRAQWRRLHTLPVQWFALGLRLRLIRFQPQAVLDEFHDGLFVCCRILPHLRVDAANGLDAGLKELKELKALEYLNLSYTQITDASLKDLKELKGLQLLWLLDTQITDAGLKDLKQALPKTRVFGP